MQQRRLRLGDILDDYCPRERRVTNHVIVAMVEDEVKQTRCATCDAEHEYKEARVPPSRRRKPADAVPPAPPAQGLPMPHRQEDIDTPEPVAGAAAESFEDDADLTPGGETVEGDADADPDPIEEDWPVHRPLIRATLPRPEGQSPERKAPDFTLRQPGGRFDADRNGGRQRGRSHHAQGGSGGHARFGTRQGAGHSSQPQRQGNRPGNAATGRSGRPQGQSRGQGPGGGHGRKRGR